MKVWKYILGGLLFGLGLSAVIAYLLTRNKTLGTAAVSAIESAYKPVIQAKQKRLEVLEKDLGSNRLEVKRLKQELREKKNSLLGFYTTVEISAEEANKRLEALEL